MPIFGPERRLIAALSSPAAAKPCAKLPQLSRGRLMPRSFCSAISSRYRRRVGFERSMIRSVTAAIVEFKAIATSLVPADAVALGQGDRGGGSPGTGTIGARHHALLGPGPSDATDP